MTLDTVLQFAYDHLGEIFAVAEIALVAVLNRRVGKVEKAQNLAPSAPITPTVSDKSTEKTVQPDPKAFKKKLREQLLSDFELYFSERSEDEMTEEERARCDVLSQYFTGG